MNNKVSRRQFIKLSAGALGGVAAAEASGLGIANAATYTKPALLKSGKEVPSLCPYCSVGCGQIVTVADGKIIDIQGNYDSPINEGTLCPKGAATFQLAVNPLRETKAKIRKPGSDKWEDISLEAAMDRIAANFKETREKTFVEKVKIGDKDKLVNHTQGIFSLGCATIDDEWNYIHQKVMRAAGLVAIENQARI